MSECPWHLSLEWHEIASTRVRQITSTMEKLRPTRQQHRQVNKSQKTINVPSEKLRSCSCSSLDSSSRKPSSRILPIKPISVAAWNVSTLSFDWWTTTPLRARSTLLALKKLKACPLAKQMSRFTTKFRAMPFRMRLYTNQKYQVVWNFLDNLQWWDTAPHISVSWSLQRGCLFVLHPFIRGFSMTCETPPPSRGYVFAVEKKNAGYSTGRLYAYSGASMDLQTGPLVFCRHNEWTCHLSGNVLQLIPQILQWWRATRSAPSWRRWVKTAQTPVKKEKTPFLIDNGGPHTAKNT